MATKRVSPTGVDSGSAGPFLTVVYALEGSRCAWGDTLLVEEGAAFSNGTATFVYIALAAGNGTDFTIIGENENVVLTPPATFTGAIGMTNACPSADVYINWAVPILNTLGAFNSASRIFNITNNNIGTNINLRIGGKSAALNHTPTVIDVGATMAAGLAYLVSAASSAVSSIRIKIDQAIVKNIKTSVLSNTCDKDNCIPEFEITSSVITDYGALYFSTTADSSMNLTLRNVSRYNFRGLTISGDNSEISLGSTVYNITKFKEHNSIFSRCYRYSVNPGDDYEFGQFSTVPTAFMQDLLLNQSTKWFRSSTVYHQAIPFVNEKTNSEDFDMAVRASSRAFYIPFNATNWFLDPNYIDAPNGNFKINTTKTSWISGRGDVKELPTADIEGYAWTGADIGAYRNPTATRAYPKINKGLKAIGGDSISLGATNSGAVNYPTENFLQARPPWATTVAGGLYSSIGGVTLGGYMMVIDYLMTSGYAPEYLGLVLGANNGTPYLGNLVPADYEFSETAPYYNTAKRFASDIAVVFKKYMEWAGGANVYPIWLGCGPATSTATSWSYINQQGFADSFTKYLGDFVPGVVTSHYVDEMKRLHPADWYTGDFDGTNGTSGPYYNAMYVNGEVTSGEINVHPHSAGSLLIADVFREAVVGIVKKNGGSSSNGIFGSICG